MKPTPPPPSPDSSPAPRKTGFWASFRIALAGAFVVLRTERNARIEATIALIVLFLGFWLRVSRSEWLVILTLIALVLALEMVNTAVEAVVDLAHPAQHPLAKRAKDSAAGAVVVAAIVSVAVGIFIFLPRFWYIAYLLLG